MLAAHEEEFISTGMNNFPDNFTLKPLQRLNRVVYAIKLVTTLDHKEIILVICHIDSCKISRNFGLQILFVIRFESDLFLLVLGLLFLVFFTVYLLLIITSVYIENDDSWILFIFEQTHKLTFNFSPLINFNLIFFFIRQDLIFDLHKNLFIIEHLNL